MWTYLTGLTQQRLTCWSGCECAAKSDPQFYTIFDEHGEQPLGLASYLRIDPLAGSIEVGWLHFSPPCSARGWRRRRWR